MTTAPIVHVGSPVREASSRTAAPRVIFVVVVAAALVGGALATSTAATTQAVADAGEDLARLLRGMALLKSAMAAAALAAVYWRLGAEVSRLRLAAYVAVAAAMAAGPGLVWGMAWVRTGAFFLHAGLLAAVVMLWRDPAVGARLSALLAARTRAPGG